MAYSTTYTDERGSSVPVSISDEESREAIRNAYDNGVRHTDRVLARNCPTKRQCLMEHLL